MVSRLPEEARKKWFTFDEVADVVGGSDRALRTKLSRISPSLVRDEPSGFGRPHKLYHFTCDPKLQAYYEQDIAPLPEPTQDPESDEPRPSIPQDDLALARLRLRAVRQYEAATNIFPKSEAAEAVCRDWRKHPQSETVNMEERMPRGHKRKISKEVTLGNFSTKSLRRWASIYKEENTLISLAPKRKQNSGRRSKDIPPELLSLVVAMATSNSRADIATALKIVRQQWPGEMPTVSIRTWQRRYNDIDPARALRSLHSRGMSSFRADHSPDIEQDWSQLAYNQRWELDDLQLDFYVHSSVNPLNVIRPYAYGIFRVDTRQWLATVVSEAHITKKQVREMVGFAMSMQRCGMPDHIVFERGTVALDEQLEELLNCCEVQWHRTSMDGGSAAPGMYPDKGKGHFQGKAVIESNIKRLHNSPLFVFQKTQVGSNERHTSHGNLETIKQESIQRVKDKLDPILPTFDQAHALVMAAMNERNDQPHSGLPKVFDEEAGARRHMTPNEMEMRQNSRPERGATRVMDDRLLPAFFAIGKKIQVTKNGFQLGRDQDGEARWYGRGNDALDQYRGRKVTAFVADAFPDVAYVLEIPGYVERYKKDSPFAATQFAMKKHNEKKYRNKLEQLREEAVKAGGCTLLTSIQATRDPVPERETRRYSSEAIMDRMRVVKKADERIKSEQTALDARFDLDEEKPVSRKKRGGLLSREEDLQEHLSILNETQLEEV